MVEPRSPKSLVWVRFPLCLDREEKKSEFNEEFRKKEETSKKKKREARGKRERRWETQKKQEKHKQEDMEDILGHHDGDSQQTIKILEPCI